MAQAQGIGRHDRDRCRRLAAPGQDVDDHVGGVDALPQSVRAGGFDGGQSVTQHRGEDLDHLPVAVLNGRELAPDPVDRTGQDPRMAGRAVWKES